MSDQINNLKELSRTVTEAVEEMMKVCDPPFKLMSNDPAKQEDDPLKNVHSLAEDILMLIKGSDGIDAEIAELRARLEPKLPLPINIKNLQMRDVAKLAGLNTKQGG